MTAITMVLPGVQEEKPRRHDVRGRQADDQEPSLAGQELVSWSTTK